ncbi:MAG: hypothetical protein WD767_11280 [Alphaproteobacteria bacterium]
MTFSKSRRYALAILGLTVAFAVYGYGIYHSPVMNPDFRAQQDLLAHYATSQHSSEEIRMLAEAYWLRNPDVAADSYFGRNGKMGILGAREHYDRHGRKEGRRWGQ